VLVDRDKAIEACAKAADKEPNKYAAAAAIRQLTLEDCRVETPRTDALKIPSEALFLLGNKGVPQKIVEAILTLGDFARQLERENAALSAQVAELRKDAERLARGNYQRLHIMVQKMNAIAAMWPCSPGTVERIRNEAIDEFAAIDAAKESGDT
jgi:hypothetical protein